MSLSSQYKKWLVGVVLQRQLLKFQPGAQAAAMCRRDNFTEKSLGVSLVQKGRTFNLQKSTTIFPKSLLKPRRKRNQIRKQNLAPTRVTLAK